MPLAELYITDGTTTVDLLGDGLCLSDWRPSYPGMKGGGTWQSSPLADGRRLAHYRYDHIVDVFSLNGRGFTQDAMIRSLQELNRLLIKARQYWTADWQDEPVYLVAKSGRETNTRYALIHSYLFPEDGAPYGQPFAKNWGRIGMEGLTLAVEHALWQSTIPGEGDCTEVYATEEYEASVNIEEHVVASSDDASVIEVVNTIDLVGPHLAFGRAGVTGNDENVGLRFQAVNVPQGATILYAYVQLQCSSPYAAVTVNVLVRCEDADDVATFSTYANFMGRPRTIGIPWSPAAWLLGEFYNTPDIASEVQAVVSRPGWAAGNDMVVFIDENGSTGANVRRVAASFDNGTYREPVLFIGYASDVTYGRERGGVCLMGDIEEHVVASSDDCYVQEVTNTIYLTSVQVAFGRIQITGNDLNAGMRFQTVNVPQGVTILYAYVQFQCRLTEANMTVNTLVSCEDADDAVTFSTYADFMGRPRTPGVAWSPGAWVLGEFYNTPDIASEVQAVVSRPGWTANNDIVVFVDENGSTAAGVIRGGASWDNLTYLEPVLFVGYSNQGQTFVANKDVMANIDHVYWYDASALMWSANLVSTMPYSLFRPGIAIATGDFVLFGIETATGAGPFTLPVFSSLVFDLIPAVYTGATTMQWQYSNGAAGWPALPAGIRDNTAAAANEPLSVAGVCSVHWTHHNAWAEEADGPMGTTCLWIKLEATVGGTVSVPQQQNRDVYQVAWPYIESDDEDIEGDVSSIIRAVLVNPGSPSSAFRRTERLIVALRSLNRGSEFTPYLNCGDEQNHASINVLLDHGGTSFANGYFSGAGRVVNWVSGGVIAVPTTVFRIQINSPLSSQYYGSYRAFLRLRGVGAGISTTFFLRIYSGSAGAIWTGPEATYTWIGATRQAVFDLGSFILPATAILRPSEHQDWVSFYIRGTCTANITLDFMDLILMPTDEWSGDFIMDHVAGYISDDDELHIDSVHYPKRDLRAIVFEISTRDVEGIWQTVANGPVQLQANRDQRLWFFASTTQPVGGLFHTEPEICHTVDVDRAQRYLSMRGDR